MGNSGLLACLKDRVGVPREGSRRGEGSPAYVTLLLFFHSAGGLSLPPKASGCGAACSSCPLVLPEQHDHDRERHPAWPWWECPHGGMSTVSEPPGTNGLPPARLCHWAAKASP